MGGPESGQLLEFCRVYQTQVETKTGQHVHAKIQGDYWSTNRPFSLVRKGNATEPVSTFLIVKTHEAAVRNDRLHRQP